MVPNHTGIDSRWVMEHPDRFLQLRHLPFPTYSFNGDNLSKRPGIGIYLEDHYWNRTDAAVVFKRVDFNTGDVRYIYHGNDGTSMPWNDTAQIDFLNPEAREAVVATIVGVCRQFPIVRFDAAMTLAKKHIHGSGIPSRNGGHRQQVGARSFREEYNRLLPRNSGGKSVDRCRRGGSDTLLLAEAFWMMKATSYDPAHAPGQQLGFHEHAQERGECEVPVHDQEHDRVRRGDPEALREFHEQTTDGITAVASIGKGDKYFGVAR
jgi:hypothetical protein